jgi:5-methylcytosine-specific restriction endonuclease McrA
MPKRKPTTPRSRVKNALRQVFLRSRERAAALKREGHTCQECHRKASVAKGKEFKVQVHHIYGILDWEKLVDLVFEMLLVPPEMLKVLCKDCHLKAHGDWEKFNKKGEVET